MTDHDKEFGKELGNELLTRFKHNKDIGVEGDAIVYLEADVIEILRKAKIVHKASHKKLKARYKSKYKQKYKPLARKKAKTSGHPVIH